MSDKTKTWKPSDKSRIEMVAKRLKKIIKDADKPSTLPYPLAFMYEDVVEAIQILEPDFNPGGD